MRFSLLAVLAVLFVGCADPDPGNDVTYATGTPDTAAPPEAHTTAPSDATTSELQAWDFVGDYECEPEQPFARVELGMVDEAAHEGIYTGYARLGEGGELRPTAEGTWTLDNGRMTFDGGDAPMAYTARIDREADSRLGSHTLILTDGTGSETRCLHTPVSP